MKASLLELFQRFAQLFPAGTDGCLRAEEVKLADPATSKSPICTLLVCGHREDGSDEPVALVAVTVPSEAPDAATILDFAVRRARAHKAPFFVTWTLRDTMLWRTPKAGTPTSRDSLEKLRDYADIYEIGAADQGPLSEPVKLSVLERGKEIVHHVEHLFKDEALELVQIDATYFVGRLLDAVQRLLPMVSASVQHRLETDVQFRGEIATWAVKQSIAGASDDPEFAKSVARQITYRLLGKVLFYQSLRRSARHLPKLDLTGADSSQVLPALRAAFAQALKIDYHAVFQEDLPDRVQWPSDASRELAGLIKDFNTRDFANLPQDVVGTVFERLIPPEERRGLGQYFTSENLCDLVTAFCVRLPDDKVLDPTCGTGTFLIRAYDRLRWLGKQDHLALLSQLWGVDIAPFPAELATINLFRQRVAEHGNFPRIICRDFFNLSPGDRFPFPPPKMDLDQPEMIEQSIPPFDAIIGNFPYVSAEQIEKHEAGYLGFLRERLIDGWFPHYPQLFSYKNRKEEEHFRKRVAAGDRTGFKRDGIEHRISTYADLYVHLFFQAARFLKPGGRMGIVTSNAWLDVNYGYALQQFFLRRFKIVAALESRCEPWFTEASVNTVVTVLERCDSPSDCDANLVRFIKVKRPLANFIPGDPVIQAAARWSHLTQLVERLERTGMKYSKTHPLGCVTEENDDVRVRILRQGEMRSEVERENRTIKWGRYLRAPQVYFDIVEQGQLCLLSEAAIPKRGGLTRINEFFHVTPEVAAQFGIENEYLWPLIKSPKETDRIIVDPDALKLRIFVCRRSKKELEGLKHRGTLRYIEWGEKQTYTKGEFKGLPWPEGAWLKKRQPGWWALPESETHTSQIYFCEAYDERHFQRYSPVPLIPDNVLCYLSPPEGVDVELLVAALNCSFTYLSLELTGRITLGDGVLRLKVEEAREYLLIPDIRRVPARSRKTILDRFQPLLARPAESVFDEIGRDDRRDFDSAVLSAIGLDARKHLKPLYDALSELARERIELGRLRGKARTTRARGERAEKKTAEDVLDEFLPQGPRRFPDEFFSTTAAAEPKAEIPLPEQPLIFEPDRMLMGVHAEDNSFQHHVSTPAEGKFLIYAHQAGQKAALLPERTIEVTRTVANYEKYLRELRKELYEAYYRRTLDTRTAARLTQAAFDRFRLPDPGTG